MAAAPPDDNNEALHEAIEKEDLETFLDLLHHPGIDLNYKQGYQTLLTASIENGNSRMAKHLIEAGCDVNLRSYCGYNPLHSALMRNRVDITLVEMLLHKGADPNAIFPHFARAPLVYAVYHCCGPSNDLEVTSMLLYYGVDVNITTSNNQTPLQMALYWRRNSCAELLLNYYDKFSNSCCYGDHTTSLHYAVYYESTLLPALLEIGADINWLDRDGQCLLYQTLRNRNMETFKYIWSRINHQLLMTHRSFLTSYILGSAFANCEYLACLDLILESPIAHHLIQHCIDYLESCVHNLVRTLLYNFKNRQILPKDRLSTIYTCLSFGIKIETKDLLCVIENYGFNEEFKALLYAGDFNCCDCIEQPC